MSPGGPPLVTARAIHTLCDPPTKQGRARLARQAHTSSSWFIDPVEVPRAYACRVAEAKVGMILPLWCHGFSKKRLPSIVRTIILESHQEIQRILPRFLQEKRMAC